MANRYWVGGTANWTNATGVTGVWAATSGGAATATAPTNVDTVLFNATSGAVTVTLTGNNKSIQAINFTGFTGTFDFGSFYISVIGTGTVVNNSATPGYTVKYGSGGPVIRLSDTSATSKTVTVGNPTEANALSIVLENSTSNIVLNAGNYRSITLLGFQGTMTNNAKTIYGDYLIDGLVSPGQSEFGANVQTFAKTDISLATTASSGTGSTATLTFAVQTVIPFIVGSRILVEGMTPSGYNTTDPAVVTACTLTTVSYASTGTGTQTVAGTIRAVQTIGLISQNNSVFSNDCSVAVTVGGSSIVYYAFTSTGNLAGALNQAAALVLTTGTLRWQSTYTFGMYATSAGSGGSTLTANGGTIDFGSSTGGLRFLGSNMTLMNTTAQVTTKGTTKKYVLYGSSFTTGTRTIRTDYQTEANAVDLEIAGGSDTIAWYTTSAQTATFGQINWGTWSGTLSLTNSSNLRIARNFAWPASFTFSIPASSIYIFNFISTSATERTIDLSGVTYTSSNISQGSINFGVSGSTSAQGLFKLTANIAWNLSPAGGAGGLGNLNLYGGTLNLNGYTATASYGGWGGSGSGNITFNGGTISMLGQAPWDCSFNSNLTTTAGAGGRGFIDMTSKNTGVSGNRDVYFGGNSFTACTIKFGDLIRVNDSGTYYDWYITPGLTNGIYLETSTTQTFTNITAFSNGTAGNLIKINWNSSTPNPTLSQASGTVNAVYSNINHVNATGGATWNAYVTNGNTVTSSTGWNTTDPFAYNAQFLQFFR
jgi:hypothetical protein